MEVCILMGTGHRINDCTEVKDPWTNSGLNEVVLQLSEIWPSKT